MDKRLLAEARQTRLVFILTVTLGFVAGLLTIGQAFVVSRIVRQAFHDGHGLAELWGLLGMAATIIVLRGVAVWGERVAASEIALRVKDDLRRRVTAHVLALGPIALGEERTGALSATVTDGIDALDVYFRDYLPGLFTALLVPLAVLVVVLPLDLLSFVVLLLTAPLIPLFMALIGMSAGGFAKKQVDAMTFLSAHFLDVMQGLTTLKLFNRSRQQIETIRRITDAYRQTTMAVLRLAFLSALALELLATLSVALVAVEIGMRLLAGGIPFEEALFILVIAPEFYLPLRALGTKYHAGSESAAAAGRVFDLLARPIPADGLRTDVPAQMAIQLEGVRVSYGEREALRGLTLTIPHGQTTALVGYSGGGKSTLAALLLRFVDVDSGAVLVNGAPLADYQRAAWRSQVAWVSQRPHLMRGTVADNIRLGDPAATDADVMAAARAAGVHEAIVTQFSQGYATHIGERGTTVSGGQAARIAIARAFLRDAPLLILDEVTANLDSESEALVLDSLERLRQGRTVLWVAHRLNTVRSADQIAVIEGGVAVESGTHAELVMRDGAYAALLAAGGEA